MVIMVIRSSQLGGSDPVMEKSIGNGDLMDVNGDLMGFDWDTLW